MVNPASSIVGMQCMGLSLRNSGVVVSPAPGIGLVGMSSNGMPFSVQSARIGVTLLENGAPNSFKVMVSLCERILCVPI